MSRALNAVHILLVNAHLVNIHWSSVPRFFTAQHFRSGFGLYTNWPVLTRATTLRDFVSGNYATQNWPLLLIAMNGASAQLNLILLCTEQGGRVRPDDNTDFLWTNLMWMVSLDFIQRDDKGAKRYLYFATHFASLVGILTKLLRLEYPDNRTGRVLRVTVPMQIGLDILYSGLLVLKR